MLTSLDLCCHSLLCVYFPGSLWNVGNSAVDADGLLCFLKMEVKERKSPLVTSLGITSRSPEKEFPHGGRCMELQKVFINQGRNNASVIGI